MGHSTSSVRPAAGERGRSADDEARVRRMTLGGGSVITRLTLVTILVPDQDEAPKWYPQILGLEKRQGATLGPGARWLVVAPQGQADMGIVLQKPEPALHGEERARAMTEQIGRGTIWVFHADNLDETYRGLSERVSSSWVPRRSRAGVARPSSSILTATDTP